MFMSNAFFYSCRMLPSVLVPLFDLKTVLSQHKCLVSLKTCRFAFNVIVFVFFFLCILNFWSKHAHCKSIIGGVDSDASKLGTFRYTRVVCVCARFAQQRNFLSSVWLVNAKNLRSSCFNEHDHCDSDHFHTFIHLFRLHSYH